MSAASKRNLRSVLLLWKDLEVQDVPLPMIKTRPDLQPRNPMLISGVTERMRRIETLKDSVENITHSLKQDANHNAPPVWLVSLHTGLYLVDGHHRLHAYQKAKRQTIPAQILRHEQGEQKAILASRLINTTGSRIGLHPTEIREAAWSTISELMKFGARSWEQVQHQGHSVRSICAAFGNGISIGSVHSMTKYVPRIAKHPDVMKSEWPTWRGAIAILKPSSSEAHPPEEDERRRAESFERLKQRYISVGQNVDAGTRMIAFREAEEMLKRAEAKQTARCVY